VTNLFDTVGALARQDTSIEGQVETLEARRTCQYTTRFGTRCNYDAIEDGVVCRFHTGDKSALRALRQEAKDLMPFVVQQFAEIAADDLQPGTTRVLAGKALGDMAYLKEEIEKAENDPEEAENKKVTRVTRRIVYPNANAS
jgi:hypothetical protein